MREEECLVRKQSIIYLMFIYIYEQGDFLLLKYIMVCVGEYS